MQDVGTSQDVGIALGTSGTPAHSEAANGTGLQIAAPNSTYTLATKELSITGQDQCLPAFSRTPGSAITLHNLVCAGSRFSLPESGQHPVHLYAMQEDLSNGASTNCLVVIRALV